MTLKHLAVLLMLLAIGCAGSEDPKKAPEKKSDDADATSKVDEPAGVPALTQVSFNVENMK